ncbi:MAG: sulfite oxidase [Acidobacteria bacterium]|nr:sulfite oxidase [Acidobacteriota bacterium]
MESNTTSRRRSFLRGLGQAGVALGLTQLLPLRSIKTVAQNAAAKIAGKEKLIIRSARPEDLETPVELLNSWITPNDTFYVRHHMYAPDVNPIEWKLTVEGEVNKPLSLSLDDLKKLPKTTLTVTLECAGNGRAFMDPPVAGVQWEKGAVGTAKWGGVRLADVLKAAGVKPTGKFLYLNGADISIGKMPDFIRQVPIEKALSPDTILAYEMNGEPLPKLHGAPLRAVISGWEGAYAVKWLNQITVADKENDGFWVKTAYRFPTKRVAPGTAVDAKDMAPVAGLVVKSLISAPKDGATVKAGTPVIISGFAWAGEANITKVDISLDNGQTWQAAKLGKDQAKYTWRQFEFEWKAPEVGSFLVMARATDDKGRMQPVVATWNPSGYLYNVIDRVRVNVEA